MSIQNSLQIITLRLIGKRRNILFGATTILFGVVAGLAINNVHTSALTYQDEVQVEFTFNPTVYVNLSSPNLTISDLSPGSSSDSNIITITTGSNETNGYTLYSTVGNSENDYTDLRLNSSNTTNVFTNLSTNKANLSAFPDNTWGYSFCDTINNCNSATYWVSGDGGVNTGYDGLPIYDDTDDATGNILADSSDASEAVIKFKIGAKAGPTQPAGTYTNVINFITVSKVVTTEYTVDFSDESGSATDMPTQQEGITTNSTIRLSSTAPTREDYAFKGWCDEYTDDDTCSGTVTMPGQLYALDTTDSSVAVEMYAIWKRSTKLDPNLAVNVKNITAGASLTIKIYADSAATGQLSVTISNGQYFDMELEGGYAEIVIYSMLAGNYSALVQYSGDDYFESAEKTANFSVTELPPNIPTEIELP